MGRLLTAGLLLTALLSCGAKQDDFAKARPDTARLFTVPVQYRGIAAKQLFGAKRLPSAQQPRAYGSYAKGCLAGGVQLAETGPTWQAMRLSRGRNWGHPELIDFVQDLSGVAAKQPGWKGLYVGDMAQARGGPMLSGHRSHQSGLDVDIWMRPAHNLSLDAKAREHMSSISTQRAGGAFVNEAWSPGHHAVLKAAAQDPRVARIFVFPGAKVQMCADETADRAWLRKLRPWWGHHYHFHVRLNCPEGALDCENQEDPPEGDGCQDARDWVRDILDPPPPDPDRPKPAPRQVLSLADLPAQCLAVLEN